MSQKSIVALANEHVPFPVAARWAGIDVWDDPSAERGVKVYCPFGETEHVDGGLEPAMRVYPDHAWCFAEDRYFTVTSLLAEVWEMPREEAAAEALHRHGYVPATYAHLFEQATKRPAPDHEALAGALTAWCEAQRSDWKEARYSPAISHQLSRCLGLLPLVRNGPDCEVWLSACKKAMQQVLTQVNSV